MPALLKLCCYGQLGGVFDFRNSNVRVHFTHQITAEQRISNEILVVPHVLADDLKYIVPNSGHGIAFNHFGMRLYFALEGKQILSSR